MITTWWITGEREGGQKCSWRAGVDSELIFHLLIYVDSHVVGWRGNITGVVLWPVFPKLRWADKILLTPASTSWPPSLIHCHRKTWGERQLTERQKKGRRKQMRLDGQRRRQRWNEMTRKGWREKTRGEGGKERERGSCVKKRTWQTTSRWRRESREVRGKVNVPLFCYCRLKTWAACLLSDNMGSLISSNMSLIKDGNIMLNRFRAKWTLYWK